MQMMIDTDTEGSRSLKMLSLLLNDYATLAAAREGESSPKLSDHTHAPAVVPTGTTAPVPPPAPVGPTLPGNEPQPRPANVLPFPGAPSLPMPPVVVPSAAAPTDATASPIVSTPAIVAPAIPAPIATAALSTASVATVDIDAAGIRWDIRIHAGNKAKKDDGTWKLRRGVDKDLAAKLVAEQKAGQLPLSVAQPATLPPPPVNPTGAEAAPVVLPVSLPPIPNAPIPAALQIPAPLPLPPVAQHGPVGLPAPAPANGGVLPVPPVPAAGPVGASNPNPVEQFRAFMGKVGSAIAAGTLTMPQVTDAHVALGVQSLQLLITRPDLIPTLEGNLGL